MVLAMLLALWLDGERASPCISVHLRASPCISVLACTYNAYKDWEAGERATVLVAESLYLIESTHHFVLRWEEHMRA